MSKGGYVYILTNYTNNVLYVGSTDSLRHRLYEHTEKIYPKSFTPKYNCFKLVYFEFYEDIEIVRKKEYQIKNWKRQWKINLIESANPNWESLNEKALDYI